MKKSNKIKKLTKTELLELKNALLNQHLKDAELKSINLEMELAQKKMVLATYKIKDEEIKIRRLKEMVQNLKQKRTKRTTAGTCRIP